MKHQIDSSDIQRVSQLIHKYRHLLRLGWPSVKSKPNIHVTQHYPEVIKMFGPPTATAAWAQERLNGMLGKIPNNSHLGMYLQLIEWCKFGKGLVIMLCIFVFVYRGDEQNTDEHMEPESTLLWISQSIWNQLDRIGKGKWLNGESIYRTEGYQT